MISYIILAIALYPYTRVTKCFQDWSSSIFRRSGFRPNKAGITLDNFLGGLKVVGSEGPICHFDYAVGRPGSSVGNLVTF